MNYPTGYILKPQVAEFETLPESEQLIMSMADMVGISTVPHALIKGNAGFAYITKRIDRNRNQDKYRGSYERCAKIIVQYSSRVGIDMAEQFALAMNGKKRNIGKGDFLKFADTCNISRTTAEKLIEKLMAFTPKWLSMCENSLLTDTLKERLIKIITERTEALL